jgi:TonB-dependent SusC/RagA subfamily outer membrane receptor
MLEGRVAGLHVIRLANGELSVRIRSSDSLLSSGEPLLVIDGMPVRHGGLSRALMALNPHEVERIDVLKDASSTAIYGTRGAHGVILIALKRDA